jgi:hypothetical protein
LADNLIENWLPAIKLLAATARGKLIVLIASAAENNCEVGVSAEKDSGEADDPP